MRSHHHHPRPPSYGHGHGDFPPPPLPPSSSSSGSSSSSWSGSTSLSAAASAGSLYASSAPAPPAPCNNWGAYPVRLPGVPPPPQQGSPPASSSSSYYFPPIQRQQGQQEFPPPPLPLPQPGNHYYPPTPQQPQQHGPAYYPPGGGPHFHPRQSQYPPGMAYYPNPAQAGYTHPVSIPGRGVHTAALNSPLMPFFQEQLDARGMGMGMELSFPPHSQQQRYTPPDSPYMRPISPASTPGGIHWQYSFKTLYNHSAATLIRLFGNDTCYALLSEPGPTKTQLLSALSLAPADYALFERVFAHIDNAVGDNTTTSPGRTIANYVAYFETVCQFVFLRVFRIYKFGSWVGEVRGVGGHMGEQDTKLIRLAELWAVTTWATTTAQLVRPPLEPPSAEEVLAAGRIVGALFYRMGETLEQEVTAGFLYALVRCARYTWKQKVSRARGGKAPGAGGGAGAGKKRKARGVQGGEVKGGEVKGAAADEEIRERLSRLEGKMEVVQGDIGTSTQQSLVATQQSLLQTEARVQTLTNNQTLLTAVITSLKSDLTTLTAENTSLKSNLTTLTANFHTMHALATATATTLTDTSSQLQSTQRSLTDTNTHLITLLTELQTVALTKQTLQTTLTAVVTDIGDAVQGPIGRLEGPVTRDLGEMSGMPRVLVGLMLKGGVGGGGETASISAGEPSSPSTPSTSSSTWDEAHGGCNHLDLDGLSGNREVEGEGPGSSGGRGLRVEGLGFYGSGFMRRGGWFIVPFSGGCFLGVVFWFFGGFFVNP